MLEPRIVLSADVVISEVLARNVQGLVDYNSDLSDWFEVHNRGTSAVDLFGWYFTDDLADPTQWQVPVSKILAPDDRLIVFASNNDYVAPNGELHTNFRLSGNGESVGLVDPSGQLLYSLNFPPQSQNIAFGMDENVQITSLVTAESTARGFVPSDNSLGSNWTGGDESFNDSSWIQGTVGVGYETGQVDPSIAAPVAYWTFDELEFGGTLTPDALGRYDGAVSGATLTTGGGGMIGEALAFDGNDDFVRPGVIPELSSPQSFSISMWFRRSVDHAGDTNNTNHLVNNVLIAQSSSLANDNLEIGTETDSIEVYLDTADLSRSVPPLSQPASIQNQTWHHLVLSYDSNATNELKLYVDGTMISQHSEYGGLVSDSGISPFTIGLSRPGSSAWGDFEGLIDDVAVWDTALDAQHVSALFGGISPLLISGYNDFIGLDLTSPLQNQNPSAYVRIPFTASTAESFDLLRLKMQYDDAFVAYINGTEVARAGTIATPQFNSTADVDRPDGKAFLSEEFLIANPPGLLREASNGNILAIQLLNFDAAAARSLVLPQLDAIASLRSRILIDEHSVATALVPTDNTLGTAWTGSGEPFDENSWTSGTTAVGYDMSLGGPPKGPVAYWTFDTLENGGATALDQTGNYDGTVTGALLTSGGQGKFGEALSFDGDNDSVSPGVIAEMVNPSAFTTSLWFRRTADHAGVALETNHSVNSVLIAQSSSDANDNLEIGSELDFIEIYLDTVELGGSISTVRQPAPIHNDTWHHLVVTYESGVANELKLYVDGGLVSQHNQYGGSVSSSGSSPFTIGLARPGQTEWGDFEGLIDDVAVWDAALNQQQVSAIFTGTSPLLIFGYNELIGVDLAGLMPGQNTSAYLRVPFTVDDPSAVVSLELAARYDDAFVAYINGTEVARAGFTGMPQFNSVADVDRPDFAGVSIANFFVTNQPGLLQAGKNILAVQAINKSLFAERFLILPQLSATVAPNRSFAFFDAPTPGNVNGNDFATVAEPAVFSVSEGTFVSDFMLDLSSGHENADIRFTTDRSVPTESSPLYTDPILITTTTMVRARVFVPDQVPSEVCSRTYIKIGGDVADDSSNLPIVVLENFEQGIPERDFHNGSIMIFEPDATGRSHLTDAPTFTSRIGFRRRGTTSFNWPQASFRIELRNEFDEDRNESLLGLPADGDWILQAFYDFDRSLLRNSFMYEVSNRIGHYSARTRFVEVYLNRDGDPLDHPAEYMGVYILVEQPEVGPDRVDIQPLKPADIVEPELTGGYLFKIDSHGPENTTWRTTRKDGTHPFVSTDPESLTTEQADYIHNYMQQWEDALFGRNSTDPVVGYRPYMDTASFIDYQLLYLMSNSSDVFNVSSYWIKDRNGKLQMGPVWDFDRSLGSDINETHPHTVWPEYFGYIWWDRLFDDEEFVQEWTDRWQELRRDVLIDGNVLSIIDAKQAETAEGAVRNFQRWSLVAPDGGPFADAGLTGWDAEVSHLRGWVKTRFKFIDTFMLPPVTFRFTGNGGPGPIDVTLSATRGTIYYTLDGSDPRMVGGGINDQALAYTGQPISVTDTTNIVARTFDSSFPGVTARLPSGPLIQIPSTDWSGPTTELISIGNIRANATNLRVSEINYNPYDALLDFGDLNVNHDEFEFIELMNVGNQPIELAGVKLVEVDVATATEGVTFTFGQQVVEPGERVAVVRNIAAFESRYGVGTTLALGNDGTGGVSGQYGGRLANGGEQLTLLDSSGRVIQQFDYNDAGDWPRRADGDGSSLELVDSTEPTNASRNWRASTEYGGTPGSAGVGPLGTVLINEVLTHTDLPVVDAIEFYNATGENIDLGGWWLSDNPATLDKYTIPAATMVPAGGYLILHETQFGFGLNSSEGDSVWLVAPDISGKPNLIIDQVDFISAAHGVSFGRWPNGTGKLFPMITTTLGAANSGPRLGPVVISEVMYNPADPMDGSDPQRLEFVELYNPTAQTFDLGGWRIDGINNFDFPAGMLIGPGQQLVVVPFDPVADFVAVAAFNTTYGVNIATDRSKYLGFYDGNLDNGGDAITLLRPDSSEPTILVIEDQIEYFDEAPWPVEPDGGGTSLHRQLSDSWGNDPINWVSGSPSPGAFGPGTTSTYVVNLQSAVVGEAGQVSGLTHEPLTVSLNHTFSNPVVFTLPASYNGADPVAVRISDIESDQFTLHLTEPSNLNGLHNAAETVSYLVIEQGTHSLENGSQIEVGMVTTTATVGLLVNNQWENVVFQTPFQETPATLTQIQSNNGINYLQTRQRNANSNHFELAIEPQENGIVQQSAETVGYLAIESGAGAWGELSYEANTTSKMFNHNQIPLDFGQAFSTPPAFLASISSRNDVDNAHLRFSNLTTTSVDLKVKEDTSFDTDVIHVDESVAYLAIGGQGLLTGGGSPIPNGATQSFSISVLTTGVVRDVDVTLNLDHPHTADLVGRLMSPDGTMVELFANVGGAGTNFHNTLLDDEASTPIDSGIAPFTGSFQPAGTLGDFDNKQAGGTWTLQITDDASNPDFGSVLGLSLTIDVAADLDGNVNHDHAVDAADIDLLFANLNSSDAIYDLNQDGGVDRSDVDELVMNLLSTHYGDTDLDQNIDISDFNDSVTNYDPAGLHSFNSWSMGNFDSDEDVDIYDLIKVLINYEPNGFGAMVVSGNDESSPVAKTVKARFPVLVTTAGGQESIRSAIAPHEIPRLHPAVNTTQQTPADLAHLSSTDAFSMSIGDGNNRWNESGKSDRNRGKLASDAVDQIFTE